ncbi:MAG: M28 family peptidase, partial [Chloroflexi bacterium]|nr:M28 family peptidase [Chloroflexota bacterium]
LLVITFLEMGAVLMLLGELGFVGVYIGGGSRIDLSEPLGPTNIITLADMPEWGAMIADGFRWLRSKPFIVFPPAVAFFIAVLGFNSLGEGLRRLIEKRMVSTAFLLRKRMLAVIVGLTAAVIFIMNNTGAAPWFAKVAQAYDGARVYEHVVALAEMEGRGQGQPGGAEAADYIAAKFEEYGLEPGWRLSSYLYPTETVLVRPIAQPELSLLDANGNVVQTFRHQLDFGYMIERHGGGGEAEAQLTLVGFKPGQTFDWENYIGLDLRGKIVLLVRGNAPPEFPTEALIRGAAGVLWVTGDGRDDITSQVANPDGESLRSPTLPIFRIRPSTAQAILQSQNLTDIFAANLPQTDSWFTHDLDVSVRMSLELGEPIETEIPNVLGYIPGSDLELGNEMVILFVRYDGLGIDPDGTVYPGANHNASGTAVLLELAHLWHEQGLDSRRTTMFVAWGGAGLDDDSAREWLEDAFNFRHVRTQGTRSNVGPSILIQLDYIGAGGDALLIHPDSSARLAELFEEASQETELAVLQQTDAAEFSGDIITRRLPLWISLKWADSDVSPDADVIENIDPAKLQIFGETLALTLTRLVRETSY